MRVKSSREGVCSGTNEGGSDLVQVAEMHDPNTGAVQVCAGGVSHWPLPSSGAQSGFKHAVARSRKEAQSPEGCAKRKRPSIPRAISVFKSLPAEIRHAERYPLVRSTPDTRDDELASTSILAILSIQPIM